MGDTDLSMTDLVVVRPNNQKEMYGPLSASMSAVEPPLWAALLAAHARGLGYTVSIIDAQLHGWNAEWTAKEVALRNPILTLIVVSGNNPTASTPVMSCVPELVTQIRRFGTKIIALAGLHPSALPEQTLRETGADFVVQGEGFYTLGYLLTALKYDKVLDLKGLWRNNGIPQPSPNIGSLDALPMPAWDLLPMHLYQAHNWHCFGDVPRQPYGVVYTSFGCPFECSFCNINTLFGKRGIRYRSPELVVDEIRHLVEVYGVKNLKIMDEMFLLNKEHVEAICEGIKDYDLNIWCYARVDTLDAAILDLLVGAGFRWLGIGVESGSDEIRQKVHKGKFSKQYIRQAFDYVRKGGLYIAANYIFGLPDETPESMQETLRFAKELNTEYANFYVAMPYPGSKLYEQAVKVPDSWAGYAQLSEDTQPMDTRYLSGDAILKFRDKAFIEYFSRPEYQSMMAQTFGPTVIDKIDEMLKFKVIRGRMVESITV